MGLPALTRASAGLAECVTGIRLHGTGRVVRMAADGGPASVPPLPASTTAPILLDGEEIGTVWLERPCRPVPLDDVLLDRLAIAAAGVVERYGPAHTTMADPALVELVVSADSDDAARGRALRLLGFAADLPIRVLTVRSRLPRDQVAGLVSQNRPVKAAPVGDVGVILATAVDPARLPAGLRAASARRTVPTGPGGRPGPRSASRPRASRSSTTPASGRWHCSPRCPGTPCATTPT